MADLLSSLRCLDPTLFGALVGGLFATFGALVGGLFVIWAQVRQQRTQELAAVRALILEMLHNAVILSSWTRSAAEQPTVPQFPVLNRSVFDQQLPLIAKRLAFADLVAILQAYTAVFVLAPGLASLQGRPKLSAENIQHSKDAAEKFFSHSRTLTLSPKFLKRKEREFAEQFFARRNGSTGQAPTGS